MCSAVHVVTLRIARLLLNGVVGGSRMRRCCGPFGGEIRGRVVVRKQSSSSLAAASKQRDVAHRFETGVVSWIGRDYG